MPNSTNDQIPSIPDNFLRIRAQHIRRRLNLRRINLYTRIIPQLPYEYIFLNLKKLLKVQPILPSQFGQSHLLELRLVKRSLVFLGLNLIVDWMVGEEDFPDH